MINSTLLNAKDIDPSALVGKPFESVCLQLTNLQKHGRQRWAAQEIKWKLIEIVAEGDETDTDENFENYLTFAGSSVLADALIKLAEKERLCCYVLKGHTLIKKVEPENKDTHATTLVFNEWGGRIYCYGEATRLSVRQMPVREIRPVPTIGTKKESTKANHMS